jgi:hypothetical protein
MAFIVEDDQVISFAEFQDLVDTDQRLLEANGGLSDDVVEAQLVRATERILSKIRASSWWQNYYTRRDPSIVYTTRADIPAVDPNKIKSRLNDFTDLAVYTALWEYILPSIADFSNEDSSERQKMGYYTNKAEQLFGELITAGDWYDFDGDDTVESGEKSPGQYNLKRIR